MRTWLAGRTHGCLVRPGGVAGGWPWLVVVGVDVDDCWFPLPGRALVDGLDAGTVGVGVTGAPGALVGEPDAPTGVVASVARAGVADGVAGGSARAGSLLGRCTGGVTPGSGTPESRPTTTAPTMPSTPTVVLRTAVAASRVRRPDSSVNTDVRRACLPTIVPRSQSPPGADVQRVQAAAQPGSRVPAVTTSLRRQAPGWHCLRRDGDLDPARDARLRRPLRARRLLAGRHGMAAISRRRPR
jgi:hypothetical protein